MFLVSLLVLAFLVCPDPNRGRGKEQLENFPEYEFFDYQGDRHREDQAGDYCDECHQLLHMSASLAISGMAWEWPCRMSLKIRALQVD
jgi:hypothetical protein